MKPLNELGRFARFQRGLADGLLHFAKTYFRPFTAKVIQYRYATFSVFIGLMILSTGILGAGLAKVEMFNNPEGDMISAQVRFPEGTSFERVKQVKNDLGAAIEKVNANAKEDFNFDGDLITAPGGFAGTSRVQFFLGLAPAETRTHVSSKDISAKLEEYLVPYPMPTAYKSAPNKAGLALVGAALLTGSPLTM